MPGKLDNALAVNNKIGSVMSFTACLIDDAFVTSSSGKKELLGLSSSASLVKLV